jgi:hypothetical protein
MFSIKHKLRWRMQMMRLIHCWGLMIQSFNWCHRLKRILESMKCWWRKTTSRQIRKRARRRRCWTSWKSSWKEYFRIWKMKRRWRKKKRMCKHLNLDSLMMKNCMSWGLLDYKKYSITTVDSIFQITRSLISSKTKWVL